MQTFTFAPLFLAFTIAAPNPFSSYWGTKDQIEITMPWPWKNSSGIESVHRRLFKSHGWCMWMWTTTHPWHIICVWLAVLALFCPKYIQARSSVNTKFRVQCPRRFSEIDPKILQTCLMCPCRAFYERVCLFFRSFLCKIPLVFRFLYFLDIWVLMDPAFPAKNQTFVKGSEGAY